MSGSSKHGCYNVRLTATRYMYFTNSSKSQTVDFDLDKFNFPVSRVIWRVLRRGDLPSMKLHYQRQKESSKLETFVIVCFASCSCVGHITSRCPIEMHPFRLGIVGGGPSSFYAASRVLSRLPEARVHVYDRLWAPHGLVRYGVAPDHPEVKASPLARMVDALFAALTCLLSFASLR